MIRKLLFIILIIAVILSLLFGCTQKNNILERPGNNSRELSEKANLVSYNAVDNEKINTEEQFEAQLREFYDFTQIFFPIWNNHIEETFELLEKFNSEETSFDDKILCSIILIEKYKKFSDDLLKIIPPHEASEAYEFSINAVSKRILFFEEFENGASVYTLIEIENEAYMYESLFWEEIDKIYDTYLGKIDIEDNIKV